MTALKAYLLLPTVVFLSNLHWPVSASPKRLSAYVITTNIPFNGIARRLEGNIEKKVNSLSIATSLLAGRPRTHH
jgi:hypothetical protein